MTNLFLDDDLECPRQRSLHSLDPPALEAGLVCIARKNIRLLWCAGGGESLVCERREIFIRRGGSGLATSCERGCQRADALFDSWAVLGERRRRHTNVKLGLRSS